MPDLRIETNALIVNTYRIDKLQDSVGDGGKNSRMDFHRVALALYRLGKYPGYHGDDSMPLSMRELSYRIKQFQASHDGLEQTGLVVPNDPTHEALMQYMNRNAKITHPANAGICSYYEHICKVTERKSNYACSTAAKYCNNPSAIPTLADEDPGVPNYLRACLIQQHERVRYTPNLLLGDKIPGRSPVKDSVIDSYHFKCYDQSSAPWHDYVPLLRLSPWHGNE